MAIAHSTLGDLVRGFYTVHPHDDAAAWRMAAMLSVGAEMAASGRADPISDASKLVPLPAASASPAPSPAVDRDSALKLPAAAAAYRVRLRRVLRQAPAPAWLDDVEPMPEAGADVAPADVPPLLPPASQRALLLDLCATRSPGDEVDLDALTEQLSAGLMIDRLPRHPARSLRNGLIVLLDHRLGMAPYRRDQLAMVQLARSLMPDDRVRVGRFEGVPGRREAFDNVRWVSRAPEAGERSSPVLILSDLSIGGPMDDDARAAGFEWAKSLQMLATDRDVLHVLVPCAAARWPAACRHHGALLEWSRTLTLAGIRRRAAHLR